MSEPNFRYTDPAYWDRAGLETLMEELPFRVLNSYDRMAFAGASRNALIATSEAEGVDIIVDGGDIDVFGLRRDGSSWCLRFTQGGDEESIQLC